MRSAASSGCCTATSSGCRRGSAISTGTSPRRRRTSRRSASPPTRRRARPRGSRPSTSRRRSEARPAPCPQVARTVTAFPRGPVAAACAARQSRHPEIAMAQLVTRRLSRPLRAGERAARPAVPRAGGALPRRCISRSSSRRTPPTATARRDRAHLAALLDRYGAPHPAPGASHYSGPLGRGFLKWEMHTEFVTYTLFADGVGRAPSPARCSTLFPADWLAAAPGKVVTSCLVRIETVAPDGGRGDASRATCRSGSCSRAWRSAGWSTARR